jgi:hypothetical protein
LFCPFWFAAIDMRPGLLRAGFVLAFRAMPSRPLTTSEIAEVRLVFAASLDYTHAFVSENASWPDFVDAMGARLQKRVRPPDDHNAITVGQTSYFPVILDTKAETLAAGNLRDMAWLMHELTHQWQYRRLGWSYLASALAVQLRLGRMAYNYQGTYPSTEAALLAAHSAGQRLAQFNLEQQGDLARDYYYRLKAGLNCSAWEPFIQEMR